jgi:hypothetical protein
MPYNFGDAAELTNKELAVEIAKRTPLTEADLAEVLPKKADKQRLAELLKILGKATDRNNKVAALQENFAELGVVTVTLLEKFLKTAC